MSPAASRSFKADHDDIARDNFIAEDGLDRLFFTFEDTGRALMHHHFRQHRTFFNNGAVDGQIAVKDGQPAVRRDGIFDAVQNPSFFRRRYAGNAFFHSPVNTLDLGVYQAVPGQFGKDRRNTAFTFQIHNIIAAGRIQF